MTNIFVTPSKARIKQRLVAIAEDALKQKGWVVARVPGAGKSSLRRLSNGTETKLASIRTTQDTWIAFPRTEDDANWATLSEVDYVVAASVDDYAKPRFAQVHLLPAEDVRNRFDRAYAARKKAGHVMPIGRGIWVSLYDKEATEPVNRVGAGAGVDHPPIAKTPLFGPTASLSASSHLMDAIGGVSAEEPLTIGEAKRRLAASLGVPESAITITISG